MPNNRINLTFTAARSAGKKLLCPFLTAGYPSIDATPGLLLAAQNAGAGVIELGVPFSDPIADGPVIAASYTQALAAGSTVDNSLGTVARARARGLTIPVLAMVSYTIIFKRGTAEFAKACVENGVDGLVLPDIPLEEAPEVVDACQDLGLRTSLLVAPTTPAARRAAIARLCNAFVYYLSVSGITGERKELPPDISANVTALRAATETPICVGFGISTAAQVRQVVHDAGADGAIVGSAIIRRITETLAKNPAQVEGAVEGLVRELAGGL